MVWSNWQGAIWRGAAVMLLFWSGLAWTQTPAPRSPGESAEPTMVVHDENGNSTRCRVLETWQLPDGRKAHLLEALTTAEKMTIVTEPGPSSNPRAMSIRIFSWGRGQTVPPPGSPLPPHMRINSGVVIKNEMPFPVDAALAESQGPKVVNHTDDTAIGGSFAPPGPQTVERVRIRLFNGGLMARLFPGRMEASQPPESPQIIQFPPEPPQSTLASPVIQVQAPVGENTVVRADHIPCPDDKGVMNAAGTDKNANNPLLQVQGAIGQPIPTGQSCEGCPSPGAAMPLPVCTVPAEPKKPWRPGEKIASWWQSKSAKPEAKLDVPPEPVVVNPQTDDKVKQADEFLTQQNKIAEKTLKEKADKIYKGSFSTAMNPTPPEMKKPEPTPLAMSGKAPEKEEKVATVAPLPPPPSDNVKPATGADAEKRDMFGSAPSQATPPGRAALETPRKEDPLMAPDRIAAPPKANKMLPPVARKPGRLSSRARKARGPPVLSRCWRRETDWKGRWHSCRCQP